MTESGRSGHFFFFPFFKLVHISLDLLFDSYYGQIAFKKPRGGPEDNFEMVLK